MDIYSKDLRIRAVDAVDRGIPRRDVVEDFSISLTTLKRWLRMRRERARTSRQALLRDAGDVSSPHSKRRGLCGANSKRTTTPLWSATAICGKRSAESGFSFAR